ncbi:unnamed protein product [Discosporangium mesarthrocarpum]
MHPYLSVCLISFALPLSSCLQPTCWARESLHAGGEQVIRRKGRGPLAASKGFSSTSTRVNEQPETAEAKGALNKSKGDLNMATSIVFKERLAKLQAEETELADELRSYTSKGASQASPPENELVHEALVATTWNAVAVMNSLPKSSPGLEKKITKRLQQIGDAACLPPWGTSTAVGSRDGQILQLKVLDVGCGDGILMPYMVKEQKKTHKKKKGKGKVAYSDKSPEQQSAQQSADAGAAATLEEAGVTGVDLSEVMVRRARLKHPKAKWIVGNLLKLSKSLDVSSPEPLFTSVVFCGSLQFFRDPIQALGEAATWLVEGGHIIVAHVQGAEFVEDECRRNPRVAPSPIPGGKEMEKWAASAGCTLLDPGDDTSQRKFLFYVMRKGSVGEL